jgi:MFS family permease
LVGQLLARIHLARSDAWLAIVAATVFISVLDRTLISGFVDPVRRDLGIGQAEMGWVLGAFFWGVPVGNAVGGLLADRYRRSSLVLILAILWSVATAACGLVTNGAMLAVCRVVMGFAQGAAVPPLLSLVADRVSPAKLPFALGLYAIGGTTAGGLALVVGQGFSVVHRTASSIWPILSVTAPWRLTFVATGFSVVVLAPLLFVAVAREGAGRKSVPVPRLRSVLPYSFSSQELRFLFLYVLGGGFVAGSNNAFRLWLPTTVARNFSPVTQATLGVVLALTGTAGCLFWTITASARIHKGRKDAALIAMIVSSALSVPFAVAAPVLNYLVATLIAAGIFALCSQSTASLSHAAIQAITRTEVRGRAAGLYLVANSLFSTGITGVIGQAATAVGSDLQKALAVISGVSATFGVACLILCVRSYRCIASRHDHEIDPVSS